MSHGLNQKPSSPPPRRKTTHIGRPHQRTLKTHCMSYVLDHKSHALLTPIPTYTAQRKGNSRTNITNGNTNGAGLSPRAPSPSSATPYTTSTLPLAPIS